MRKKIKILLLMCILLVCAAVIPSMSVYATGEENPRVLIENYQLSTEEVIPGEEFDLTLKLRNTSQFYDVYSVVVSAADEAEMIYPIYGNSNQVYTNRVYARNSSEVVFHLQAADTITQSVIPLEITITYNDNYFIEKQSNTTVLYLPVRLDGDLNIISCAVPESISVGTKARVSVSYENTGLKTLHNIRMKVTRRKSDGNNSSVTNLYSLSGGEKSTAEVYIDCNEEGSIPITISFTYEDEQGKTYETEGMAYGIRVTSKQVEAEEENVTIIGGGVSFFTYLILAAIVIIAIGILVIIKKKRR